MSREYLQDLIFGCPFSGENDQVTNVKSYGGPHTLRRFGGSSAKISNEVSFVHDTSLKISDAGQYVRFNGGSTAFGLNDYDAAFWKDTSNVTEFSIRFRVRLINSVSETGFFGYHDPPYLCLGTNSSGTLRFVPDSPVTTSFVMSVDTDYFIEISRDSSNMMRLFVNGAIVWSGTLTSAINLSEEMSLGSDPVYYAKNCQGYFDEFEFVRRAINTSAYTPPSDSFVKSLYGTVKDKDGALAEGRGIYLIQENNSFTAIKSLESDVNGEFNFQCPAFESKLIFYGEPNRNALVFSGVIPEGSSGNTPDEPWTPAEITTALWLDAADSDTITLNGSNVSQWDDKSENVTVTQETAGNQPLYFSNENSLGFSSDFFSAVSDDLATDSFSIFTVCYPISSGTLRSESTTGTLATVGNSVLFGAQFKDSPNAGVGLAVGTNFIGMFEHSSGHAPWPCFKSVTNSSSEYMIVQGEVISKQYKIWKNASLIHTGLTSARTSVILDAITIGDYSNWGAFVGRIREIIVVAGAVDETTRQKIEGYFAWKWGGI